MKEVVYRDRGLSVREKEKVAGEGRQGARG